MFNGDFRNKAFDKRFITHIAINALLAVSPCNRSRSRDLNDLMTDVTWDYIEEPHYSVGGGTGGSKTVVPYDNIYALAKRLALWISVTLRRNSDLSGLKKIPVFHGRVYTSKEDIIQCF